MLFFIENNFLRWCHPHQTSTVSTLADPNLLLADCITEGMMYNGKKKNPAFRRDMDST